MTPSGKKQYGSSLGSSTVEKAVLRPLSSPCFSIWVQTLAVIYMAVGMPR